MRTSSSVAHRLELGKNLLGKIITKAPFHGRVEAVDGALPRRRADARHRMTLAKAMCDGSSVCQHFNRRRCLPPRDVSCSVRLQRPCWRWRLSWWWHVHCSSLPALTKGGRALVRDQGVRQQRSNPHRSLPAHVLQLPAARQRVPRCAPEMLSCMMLFDSLESRRVPHIVKKLSVTRVLCTSCESARTKKIARMSA